MKIVVVESADIDLADLRPEAYVDSSPSGGSSENALPGAIESDQSEARARAAEVQSRVKGALRALEMARILPKYEKAARHARTAEKLLNLVSHENRRLRLYNI